MSIIVDLMITIKSMDHVTIVDMAFNDWLLAHLKASNWSQAELAKRSGLTRGAVSNYINGRTPAEGALRKIAHALHVSPETVFRAAGLLPPKAEADELTERVEHILGSYKYPETKERALAYLEFLRIEEEKGEYRVKPAKHPASSETS